MLIMQMRFKAGLFDEVALNVVKKQGGFFIETDDGYVDSPGRMMDINELKLELYMCMDSLENFMLNYESITGQQPLLEIDIFENDLSDREQEEFSPIIDMLKEGKDIIRR